MVNYWTEEFVHWSPSGVFVLSGQETVVDLLSKTTSNKNFRRDSEEFKFLFMLNDRGQRDLDLLRFK